MKQPFPNVLAIVVLQPCPQRILPVRQERHHVGAVYHCEAYAHVIRALHPFGKVRRVEDDVVLIVEDSGVGIPEDSLPYIFDRFYRVDKARSREAGGSGLGLSIVHDLVEGNYGTVSVERLEAGGTKFTVIFPYFGLEDEST